MDRRRSAAWVRGRAQFRVAAALSHRVMRRRANALAKGKKTNASEGKLGSAWVKKHFSRDVRMSLLA